MSLSEKERAAGILTELIQDAEYRRDSVANANNFQNVRQEWIERARKAIEEVEALKVLPVGSFDSFNSLDITGSLPEYEGNLAAAAATREAFDYDIKCLSMVRIHLLSQSPS
jgi:hypothetical protein